MRIAIVTDAAAPQVNGVINTLKATRNCLQNGGHEVRLVDSAGLDTFAVPDAAFPETTGTFEDVACRA